MTSGRARSARRRSHEAHGEISTTKPHRGPFTLHDLKGRFTALHKTARERKTRCRWSACRCALEKEIYALAPSVIFLDASLRVRRELAAAALYHNGELAMMAAACWDATRRTPSSWRGTWPPTNARCGEFPRQSTGDQWFDESQFESYRALGYHAAHETLERAVRAKQHPTRQTVTLEDLFRHLREIWSPPPPALVEPQVVARTAISGVRGRGPGVRAVSGLRARLWSRRSQHSALSAAPLIDLIAGPLASAWSRSRRGLNGYGQGATCRHPPRNGRKRSKSPSSVMSVMPLSRQEAAINASLSSEGFS